MSYFTACPLRNDNTSEPISQEDGELVLNPAINLKSFDVMVRESIKQEGLIYFTVVFHSNEGNPVTWFYRKEEDRDKAFESLCLPDNKDLSNG